MTTAKNVNVKELKVNSKKATAKLVAENEATKVIERSFLDMTDEEISQKLKSKNIEKVILQATEKSSTIWRSEITHKNGERQKNIVSKLRKEQTKLCKSVKHWSEVKNKENLNDSLYYLLDFSKKNLKDIKNYVGAQRNKEETELCKIAYDLLFNAKI